MKMIWMILISILILPRTQSVNLGGKKKSKKPLKKPVFSRPIQDDPNLTDEQIIRAQVKFSGIILLSPKR